MSTLRDLAHNLTGGARVVFGAPVSVLRFRIGDELVRAGQCAEAAAAYRRAIPALAAAGSSDVRPARIGLLRAALVSGAYSADISALGLSGVVPRSQLAM